MGERREFIGVYEDMGDINGVPCFSVDDQIANVSNEVIRCLNCKRRTTLIIAGEERHGCPEMRGYCEDTDYCSKGVRK